MIINPVVGAFFSKYKLLFQALAVVLAIIAITILWNRFIAEPYRAQGRAEVQSAWDVQRAEAEKQHANDLAIARQIERNRAKAIALELNQYIKEKNNEHKALTDSLDRYRADNRRLRTITGQTVSSKDGVSGTSAVTRELNGTCEARLPAEIGEGFERLRATALRIGSEANEAAIKLNTMQGAASANAGGEP